MSARASGIRFVLDPITSPEVCALVEAHLAAMQEHSPPGSCHALAIDELRRPEVKFWSVWVGDELVGCGALGTWSADDGEIKSMHVRAAWRGRGIAAPLLEHLEREARAAGLSRLWLETGSSDEFAAARRLYSRHGYVECGPFGGYREDANSTFMTKRL